MKRKTLIAAALSVAMLCGTVALPARAAEPIAYSDAAATSVAMTAQIKARETDVTVSYELTGISGSDIEPFARDLYSRALAHTGNPVEGDYLYMHILHMDAPISWSTTGDTTTGTIRFHMDYAADAAQEEATTAAVNALMTQLNLNGKSDYEKAKSIYDYICGNITYDYNHNNLSHSAYAAIVNKTAVCQGYSALFYRLALTAGLDARCITGRSNNEDHGWNIVKVDGNWYNVDSTWGARANPENYFLKGSDNFPDHARDEAFASSAFTAAYPMSAADYEAGGIPAPSPEPTPEPAPAGFTDVEPGSFYADAVAWAVANNVTSGITPTTFEPYRPCTRGQVVTFLYRAAKASPAAGSGNFTDLVPGSYYSDAVGWAVAKGVTSGITPTTFEPETICNRGQVVTFLHRALGAPEESAELAFNDVDAGAFYGKAVTWAVANGVTSGLTTDTFGPYEPCNRGQVVTFLYRAFRAY